MQRTRKNVGKVVSRIEIQREKIGKKWKDVHKMTGVLQIIKNYFIKIIYAFKSYCEFFV